jgi:hydroxyacyl-ACP dehydratase HTD2-like protein with hotdog domain
MAAPSRRVSDAAVGEALPTLTKHVTIVTNFLFGVPFWTAHRLHYDTISAREDGYDAPLIPGALMTAYASRVLVGWAGRPDALRELTSRATASAVVGETLVISGSVRAIDMTDTGALATCDLTVTSGDRLVMEVAGVVELLP